jgi:7-cyano-7-deazaguanine synthase
MKGPDRAVILLSGGLDSATVLAIARSRGHECLALSVDYGQRHRHELAAAEAVAKDLGASEHKVVRLCLGGLGGSALISGIEVPKGRGDAEMAEGIPITYVPARNTIMISIALAWAEAWGADSIWVGVNAVDYSGYPDCRPEYIAAWQELARLATKAGVEGRAIRIQAPLIEMSKAEIIRTGLGLAVDFGLTTSCYDPSAQGRPCGGCDACQIRSRAFAEVGIEDPALAR